MFTLATSFHGGFSHAVRARYSKTIPQVSGRTDQKRKLDTLRAREASLHPVSSSRQSVMPTRKTTPIATAGHGRSEATQPAAGATPEGAVGTGTVSRALQLLAVLADAHGEVSIKYVAETMGLAPSTAHRLLQLLRKEGFVQSRPGSRNYTIGTQFYRVAARVLGTVTVPDVAREFIERIAAKFDETVLFGLYMAAQHAVSFAARADGMQMLRYQIELHQPLPLIWGASGKSILAFLQPDEVAATLAAALPSPVTRERPPGLDELTAELQTIRSCGYAVSESEKLPDARGIAAPVFGPGGVIGCVCLTSPKARMPHGSIEEIGLELVGHANELSRVLGGTVDTGGPAAARAARAMRI
jgi:DNA-binding IclR family transcriptional regulator